MSDSKLDFSKARPGDVLWSDKHGEVTFLDHIVSDSVYPLRARDSCGTVRRWNWMGFLPGRHISNDLHWSRPQFEEPPPPKRMKTVRIERRVHVFEDERCDGSYYFRVTEVYTDPLSGCLSHFDICHEFEVEE